MSCFVNISKITTLTTHHLISSQNWPLATTSTASPLSHVPSTSHLDLCISLMTSLPSTTLTGSGLSVAQQPKALKMEQGASHRVKARSLTGLKGTQVTLLLSYFWPDLPHPLKAFPLLAHTISTCHFQRPVQLLPQKQFQKTTASNTCHMPGQNHCPRQSITVASFHNLFIQVRTEAYMLFFKAKPEQSKFYFKDQSL